MAVRCKGLNFARLDASGVAGVGTGVPGYGGGFLLSIMESWLVSFFLAVSFFLCE